MKAYRLELETGFVVKSYGDGLMMIKAANRTAGRCLFFMVSGEDSDSLVALLAYKKESDEAPKRVLETALERMKEVKAR